ncbi:MAG: hypothetical protein ACRCTZ_14815 [Sarcina sp.]
MKEHQLNFINFLNKKLGNISEKFSTRVVKSNMGNYFVIYNLKRDFRDETQDDVTLELYEKCEKFNKKLIFDKKFKMDGVYISYGTNEVKVFVEKIR